MIPCGRVSLSNLTQTLEELREWLLHTLGISVSVSNLCGRLRKLGPDTQKKVTRGGRARPCRHRRSQAGLERAEAEARSQAAGFPGRDLDQDQHDQVAWPGATGPATDRQSALWTLEDEHIPGRFATRPVVAPLVLDGAINGCAFLAYVEQFLAPTLHPGDIVIADNLSSHKVSGVRDAIEARGAQPLVPASLLARPQPDRTSLRKAKSPATAKPPHAPEKPFWRRIGAIVQTFKPTECANFPRKPPGYTQSA